MLLLRRYLRAWREYRDLCESVEWGGICGDAEDGEGS